MEDNLCILFIILIVWLIIYLILEFNIINKKRIDVKRSFFEIDEMFEKRINILSKLVDIVKGYDKNQFDEFGSKLYDYSNSYNDYDVNKKIEINQLIESDIKKLLLVSKVYPELNELSKFVKLEKQLIRYAKVIKKMKIKYNKVLDTYNNRKKIFPSGLLCSICNFYNYNYFKM
jgi:LemA protein